MSPGCEIDSVQVFSAYRTYRKEFFSSETYILTHQKGKYFVSISVLHFPNNTPCTSFTNELLMMSGIWNDVRLVGL